MKYYFAPLEGITGYIFRNIYEKYYGGIDKYFAPFISPAENSPMNPKERRDVLPENNSGIRLVPQILACKACYFMDAANELMDMGYTEVNLNVGCPSGTVCAKGKGAALLGDTDKLMHFLDEVYEFGEAKSINISIKTRVGMYSPDEWEDILDVYNRYPVYELIVHPRVGKDYYNGTPRMECFRYAESYSKNPLVYNGDLFYSGDVRKMLVDVDEDKVGALMLGRGLIRNPELIKSSRCDEINDCNPDTGLLMEYCNELYSAYSECMSGERNLLFKMKGIWTYLGLSFPKKERELKELLKSKSCAEYKVAVRKIIKN